MILRFGTIVILWLVIMGASHAAESTMPRQSDISNTLHNLSTTGSGTTKASSESQICAFCHTPHGANADAQTINAPLWNRDITLGNDSTYIAYNSSSIQANIDANPGGASKLCLSCHDGTLALGSLNVLNGATNNVDVDMGADLGVETFMPDGTGANTGFTRNLGTDLSGDHPISFSFDTSNVANTRLAAADGELRDPLDPDGAHIATGSKIAPLDKDGKVQCTTCHDPHVSGNDNPNDLTATTNNIKFLRARRFQMSPPTGVNFDQNNDIMCLGCHDKLGTAWSQSAHADPTVADEQYKIESSNQRQFPANIAVWQAACLNCHDTHTVQGANRLLREGTLDGTDTTLEMLPAAKLGGKPALEETCFQCHTTPTQSILKTGSGAPDIETEFGKDRRMPLGVYVGTNLDKEPHDIVDADFTEPRLQLGLGNLDNRHAECTDCHNPHRMIKNSLAYGSGGVSTKGTHPHEELAGAAHSNAISGVLKGISGVEPDFTFNNADTDGRKFGTPAAMPKDFIVKKGLGGDAVTAEYQICLKCHSNYAYIDNGLPENLSSRPALPTLSAASGGPGGTPSTGGSSDTTSLVYYTNQAMEFQAPSTHANETASLNLGIDGGAAVANDNHRSWHPVIAATGRTLAKRGGQYGTMASGNFKAPWGNAVGTQTMYCTDCHGAENGTAKNSTPGTAPWGPHGSSQDFILRGQWTRGTGQNDGGEGLCFKCHTEKAYKGSGDGSSGWSGFRISRDDRDKVDETIYNNGHSGHASTEVKSDLVCTWCHVAVPHGWKNKALLVNLNDIGPEVLCRADDLPYNDDQSLGTGKYDVRVPEGDGVENSGTESFDRCELGQPMPAGTVVDNSGISGSSGYDNPPYYINARLKLTRFATGGSGTWKESDCGGISQMQATCDEPSGF